MSAKYKWVVTKRIYRSRGPFGGRRSETRTFIPAKRNAQRRTRTVGFFKPRDTVTEEWRLVDEAGKVID